MENKLSGYPCPICNEKTTVTDSRFSAVGAKRRRRRCTACDHRFTTYERTLQPSAKQVEAISRARKILDDLLTDVLFEQEQDKAES